MADRMDLMIRKMELAWEWATLVKTQSVTPNAVAADTPTVLDTFEKAYKKLDEVVGDPFKTV